MGLSIEQKLKVLDLSIAFCTSLNDNCSYEQKLQDVFEVVEFIEDYIFIKTPIKKTSRTSTK